MLFLRLHDRRGQTGLLDLAARALRQDLAQCVRGDNGALAVNEGRRTTPYLGAGSAGIGAVVDEYLTRGHDDELAAARPGILRAASATWPSPTTSSCACPWTWPPEQRAACSDSAPHCAPTTPPPCPSSPTTTPEHLSGAATHEVQVERRPDALRLVDPGQPSSPGHAWDKMVIGLHSAAVTSEVAGDFRAVQVEFTPLGAYACLRLPLHHLADTLVAPDEVLGRSTTSRLTGMLADAADWEHRWTILDEAITALLRDAPAPSPVVAQAWAHLDKSHATTVDELAGITGRSRRRLEMLFREQVGLPPGTLRRVLRLQSAITALKRTDLTFTEIATRCGYYDQSHLNRDFRSITGLTPGEFDALAKSSSRANRLSVGDRLHRIRIGSVQAPHLPAEPSEPRSSRPARGPRPSGRDRQ
ncbi:helix-turn-helix domain-containing protein [Saccharothrix xinjiangensis]|uniref:Helix-turn-helix domain-containing protein n=1 Tax=Saccharothrix xinjiangensis TaxID=204798 RepID=A0ABV9XXJ4_9PSEU